jgi:excisionase family DNA binding protein
MALVLENFIGSDQSNEKFYTVAEVADLLRLHPDTVRRQIQLGRLRGFGIGGNGVKVARYVISAGHLADYLRRFEIKAKANTAN